MSSKAMLHYIPNFSEAERIFWDQVKDEKVELSKDTHIQSNVLCKWMPQNMPTISIWRFQEPPSSADCHEGELQIASLPKSTRSHRFTRRTPSSRHRESNLAKKTKVLARQKCCLLDNGWVCCSRLSCVYAIDKDVIQSRRSAFLGMSYFEREKTLKSMLQKDGRFEGLYVCQKFVTEVLTISNIVIAAVKGLRRHVVLWNAGRHGSRGRSVCSCSPCRAHSRRCWLGI